MENNMKIYSTEVRAGLGNCGQYWQFRRFRGELQSRFVELFTHGPTQYSAWGPVRGDEMTDGLPDRIAAEVERARMYRLRED